jgi:hypothetical protein
MIKKSTDSRSFRCLPFILCGMLLRAPSATAGGSEYGLEGAETVARGGANTAKASGPEALYLNVAGISKEEGIKILIDANFVSARMTAKLFGDEEKIGNGAESWYVPGVGTIKYIPVSNTTDIYAGDFKMFPAPIAGITFPIPQFRKLTLGFAFLSPAALGSYQFPETVQPDIEGIDCSLPPQSDELVCNLPSPQRYDLIYEDVLFMWPTIAASYRLTEKLSLGAGFQWGIFHVIFKTAINNGMVSTPTSFNNDTISTLDAWDYFVPAGILGLSWNPIDRVEFGFGVRISDKIHAKGKLTAVTNPWGDDPISSDDPTLTWMDEEPYKRPTGALTFAWPTTVWRFGVRYKHPKKNAPTASGRSLYPWEAELFDIELDFFVEQNHVVEAMDMRVDGQIPYGRNYGEANPFNPDNGGIVKDRRNWRDVVSVRLGGSVNLLKGMLTINWGGFYESPTVYDEDTRLDYLNNERFGLSCGLQGRFFSFHVRGSDIGIEASLSYAHFFFNKFSVREGKIRHIAYIGETGTVVNNGDYEFAMDILTAGIRLTIL